MEAKKDSVKKPKVKNRTKDQDGVKDEMVDLAKILTGEMALRSKQKKILAEKKAAIERQKDAVRRGVTQGEVFLEGQDLVEEKPKKVVQKIKLFEWEAPVRQMFFFDMKTFLVIVGVSLVFILFLAILGHYDLMVAIIALLFFIYVAGTTKPVNTKHVITARGVETFDKLYEWFMLDNFWFTEKNGQNLLMINTNLRVPGRLILLLDAKDRSTIFMLLQDRLLYNDIKKQSWFEKSSYGEYIELEKV